MTRIICYYLIATILLMACNKEEDPVFDKSANQRLNESLDNYQQILTSAPNGWKMFTFPKEGGYAYMINFKTDGSATVLFDISDETMTLEETTTYRLRALQAPSLVFDTYSNYIHYFSDPDIYNSSSAYSGDFEYTFVNISGDTIFCIGAFNKCNMFLVKAQEGDAGKIRDISDVFNHIAQIKTNYWTKLVMDVDDSEYEIAYSLQQPRTLTFYYHEGVKKKAFTTGYYFNENSLTLIKPFKHENTQIDGFRDMVYHEEQNKITLQLTNNNASATIRGKVETPVVDVAVAKEMVMAIDMVYVAMAGFTIAGVPDAYGLAKKAEFTALQLYNNYWEDNSETSKYYGAFFIFPEWTGNYITNDLSRIDEGIVRFIDLGVGDPVPESLALAYNANLAVLRNNEFNVVKTDTDKYDLVSLDGSIWLNLIKYQ